MFFSFILLLLITGTELILPKVLGEMIDSGIEGKNFLILGELAAVYLMLTFTSHLVDFMLKRYFQRLKLQVCEKLRMDLVENLRTIDGHYLSAKSSGSLLHIVDGDLDNIGSFGIDRIFDLITNLITGIAVLVIFIQFDVRLVLVTVLIQSIQFYINFRMTNLTGKRIRNVRNAIGRLAEVQEQFIANLKLCVLANVTGYFLGRIRKEQSCFTRDSLEADSLIIGQKDLTMALQDLSVILSYLIGGYFIIQDQMTLGQLVSFMEYAALLAGPCIFMMNINIEIQQASASLEKYYDELETIQKNGQVKDGRQKIARIDDIYFENVSFSYVQGIQILEHFDMELEKGDHIALVGESGCGKSTIVNLLYRLWEPNEGKILINGRNIADYNLQDLRDRIAIISQDSFIADENIEENLVLEGRQVSREETEEICSAMGINSLVSEKKNKTVGESGETLSGGQKQRIALARALLKDCDVIVLDESTSSLDNASQQAVMKAIVPYLKGKIVINIAHRVEATELAARIMVMDSGRIVEQGTRGELLGRCGLYYHIVTTQ